MTYKHGNWFCKPANEAEASEIVERAVASGAVDNKRDWVFKAKFYGVYDGVVRAYDEGAEYTIEQVRELFPLLGEGEAAISKSSYAKQKYPIGTLVDVRVNGVWYPATVHGHAGNYIIVRADGFWYDEYTTEDVRQTRSERDRWVEEAAIALHKDAALTPEQASYAAGAIYDAIKSGSIKAPVVERSLNNPLKRSSLSIFRLALLLESGVAYNNWLL